MKCIKECAGALKRNPYRSITKKDTKWKLTNNYFIRTRQKYPANDDQKRGRMSKKHVFVIGLDDFNRQKLRTLPLAEEIEFYTALTYRDIQSGRKLDIRKLIHLADHRIRGAGVSVDAIISFYDFPATLLVPVLAKRFDVPAPALEEILTCEHKLWSRMAQQKIIPGYLPRFFPFDPFDNGIAEKIPLRFPYWIKPVKSFLSYLAYKIESRADFDEALPEIRRKSVYFNEPFQHILELSGLPADKLDMKNSFIAENQLSGRMCTAEGYVYNGKAVVHGIIDSVREPGKSSFVRYEYPSTIPRKVQNRITSLACRIIEGIGLKQSTFNIEFFWNQNRNQIRLLEINPRISESHADLFEKVHGVSNLAILVDIALGNKPPAFENSGRYKAAAKFMHRVFEDGIVTNVPDEKVLRFIAKEIPGTVIKPAVKAGNRLSTLPFQDSYSYLLASIFIGGEDRADLQRKYRRCLELLNFEVVPADPHLVHIQQAAYS